MKLATYIAGLLGLAVAIALIAHEGFGAIAQMLGVAGWGLLWLIPLHVLPLAMDAEGWRNLLRPRDPRRYASLPFLLWIATVREAINRLLPVASVGGEIVGIRLAMLRPLPGVVVTASVILEVLLTIVNQYLFTAVGLVLLVTMMRGSSTTSALLWGLLVTLPVPVLLLLLLRYGNLFGRIERVLLHMLGDEHKLASLFSNSCALDEEIRGLYRRQGRLWLALVWQLAGMITGATETWLALRLLGHPVNVWEAVTLESLTLAIRHFAFFVPGGVGVQEAGLVLFGNLMGLPADAAVALSLAKRSREIGFGLPALASWQWIEIRRFKLHVKLRRDGGDAR